MPITWRSFALLEREAGDHPGVGRAGDGADDDVVEEDVVLGFLHRDLASPVGEPEPAERVVGGAGRNRVRLAARLDDGVECSLPTVADPDVEAGRVEAHIATHDPRELDVADLVVHDVGPVDPGLLHRHRLEPEVGRDAGDLARVVRLHPADRDQRVAALGEGVGHEVLELAGLVAAERDAGVAVLPLGPDLDPAAEVGAEARQRMDGRRTERERIALEVVETTPSARG